jgi:Cu/Ag efflux protein CusF
MRTNWIWILLVFIAIPLSGIAQTVGQGEAIEITAEIIAIDAEERIITLEDEDTGEIEEIYAGPEVKRFDELKVGDEVTFLYYESLVSSIRKPGDPAPPAAAAAAVRGTGARPSGALAEQVTATVTIVGMDKDVPSVTVETEDEETMSFKIADKAVLESVKVGDTVDITYTSAVMITVK